MTRDSELLAVYAQKGSSADFDEFVRRHVGFVFAIAYRRVGGDAHAARDVSQATFITASRKAASLARHGAIAGWLYLTTRNLSAQYVRADRRRVRREVESAGEHTASPNDTQTWNEAWPALDRLLDSVGRTDREIVLLRFMEQKSFSEIGRAVHLSEDAARMRLDRTLSRLRAALSRKGAATATAALALLMEVPVVAAPPALAAQISVSVARLDAQVAARGYGAAHRVAKIVKTAAICGAVLAGVVWVFEHFGASAGSLAVGPTSRVSRPAAAPVKRDGPALPTARNVIPRTASLGASEPATGGAPKGPAPATIKSRFASPADRAAQLARAVAFYDPLVRKLNLSGAQADAFRQALSVYEGQRDDVIDVAQSMALKTADPDVQAMLTEANNALMASIQSQFGDSTASALSDYVNSGALRELTTTLTGALADTGMPLTPDQADLLVQIMATNQTSGVTRPTPRTVDMTTTLSEAQMVLSPQQVIAFKTALRTWH